MRNLEEKSQHYINFIKIKTKIQIFDKIYLEKER